MARWQKIQFLFGVLLFLAFLATGQYLMRVFKPLHLGELHLRMLARANHIYILFAALLNIIGALVPPAGSPWARKSADCGRLAFMSAGVYFLWIFFQPPTEPIFPRPNTLYALILCLAGTALFLPQAWGQKSPQ